MKNLLFILVSAALMTLVFGCASSKHTAATQFSNDVPQMDADNHTAATENDTATAASLDNTPNADTTTAKTKKSSLPDDDIYAKKNSVKNAGVVKYKPTFVNANTFVFSDGASYKDIVAVHSNGWKIRFTDSRFTSTVPDPNAIPPYLGYAPANGITVGIGISTGNTGGGNYDPNNVVGNNNSQYGFQNPFINPSSRQCSKTMLAKSEMKEGKL